MKLRLEQIMISAIVIDLQLSQPKEKKMKLLLASQDLDEKMHGLPVVAEAKHKGEYHLLSNLIAVRFAQELGLTHVWSLVGECAEEDYLFWKVYLNEPPKDVFVLIPVIIQLLDYFRSGQGKKFRDPSGAEETLREFIADMLETNRTTIGYLLKLLNEGRQDLLGEINTGGLSIKDAIDIHSKKPIHCKRKSYGKERLKKLQRVEDLGEQVVDFLLNGLSEEIANALAKGQLDGEIAVEEEVLGDFDLRHIRIVLDTPSYGVTIDLVSKDDNGDPDYIIPIIPQNPNAGLDEDGYQLPLAA